MISEINLLARTLFISLSPVLCSQAKKFYRKFMEEKEVLSKKIHNKGKKIVFTNGCFDILHTGHVKYLEIVSR